MLYRSGVRVLPVYSRDAQRQAYLWNNLARLFACFAKTVTDYGVR